ncbi:hypothetical protein E2C01_095115 [Portunus trituberculatus]|uniref:Uncharacterized protein n=1 Tax=Portunus trituberculatus TaxID=210409 RepID=A0A5B7K2X1_PORTR|nr:hypothetical protein [Portunus trituberculatus]
MRRRKRDTENAKWESWKEKRRCAHYCIGTVGFGLPTRREWRLIWAITCGRGRCCGAYVYVFTATVSTTTRITNKNKKNNTYNKDTTTTSTTT